MKEHFARIPCSKNLIQLEEGPSVSNLLKEIRYSTYYNNNPGPILLKSEKNNKAEGVALGGSYHLASHGYDISSAIGILPDIEPCTDNIESPECNNSSTSTNNTSTNNTSTNNTSTINTKENLIEIRENMVEFNPCIIIIILLFIVLVISLYCKIN